MSTLQEMIDRQYRVYGRSGTRQRRGGAMIARRTLLVGLPALMAAAAVIGPAAALASSASVFRAGQARSDFAEFINTATLGTLRRFGRNCRKNARLCASPEALLLIEQLERFEDDHAPTVARRRRGRGERRP
jgi:hypothetical protein